MCVVVVAVRSVIFPLLFCVHCLLFVNLFLFDFVSPPLCVVFAIVFLLLAVVSLFMYVFVVVVCVCCCCCLCLLLL